MIVMNVLSSGRARCRTGRRSAAREDVERRREPEVDDRVPELVVHRVVVVGVAGGSPGSITPRSPSALIASRSAMPSSGVRIAVCPMPISRSGAVRAELGDPLVVRVEARVLVVDVGVVAQHHADRRVDDLGGDAVEVLVGEARHRIPAAAPQVLEALAGVEADLFGRAGRPRRRARTARGSCRRRSSITSPSVSS